jgi:hypothetical protein
MHLFLIEFLITLETQIIKNMTDDVFSERDTFLSHNESNMVSLA